MGDHSSEAKAAAERSYVRGWRMPLNSSRLLNISLMGKMTRGRAFRGAGRAS